MTDHMPTNDLYELYLKRKIFDFCESGVKNGFRHVVALQSKFFLEMALEYHKVREKQNGFFFKL